MDRHGPAMKAQWREWIRDGGAVERMGGMKGRVHPGFSPPLSLSVTKRPGRAPDRSLSPLILCLSRERNRGNGEASPHLPWLSVPRCLSIVFSFSLSVAAERPTRCLFFSLSRPPALSPVVSLPSAHFCLPGASTLGFVVPPSLVIVSRFPLPLLARPPVRPLSLFFAVSLSAAHSLSSCSPTHSPSPSHLSLGRPLACQSCLLSFSLCLSPTHTTRSLSPHPLDHCLPTPARSSLVIRKKKACAFVSSSLGRQSAQNNFFKKKEQKLQHRVFPCGPPP